jgi:RNA polymerase sigma-70 factor (ECF subfamily)
MAHQTIPRSGRVTWQELVAGWRQAWAGRLPAEQEEVALVRAARAGSRLAFAELVRRYQDRIYRVARVLCPEPPAAVRLTEAIFATAHGRLAALRLAGDFEACLYRIAIETGASVDRSALAGESDEAPLSPCLRAALAELPQPVRLALLLHDGEGLPPETVARLLGATPAAVRAHLRRGRAGLLQAGVGRGEEVVA